MSMNLTITTFNQLYEWVYAFMRPDGLSLMFLIGSSGASKSHSIKAMLAPEHHRYVKCARLTAFQMYKQFYKHRNKAIILDDLEDALNNSDKARLLMNLCETDEESRVVAWFGSESLLKVKKAKKVISIPQEFETNSRVLIVSNDVDILLSKFQALLDRGTIVFFDPSPEEIHLFVDEWFDDEEIYGFIRKHLAQITQHSIRYYVIAKEHKRLGLDWRKALLESWTNESKEIDPERVVELLLVDPRYTSDKDRIEAFTAKCGRQRRQWYNLKKKVVKRMKLPRPVPESDHAHLEAVTGNLDLLQPESIPHEALHQ